MCTKNKSNPEKNSLNPKRIQQDRTKNSVKSEKGKGQKKTRPSVQKSVGTTDLSARVSEVK